MTKAKETEKMKIRIDMELDLNLKVAEKIRTRQSMRAEVHEHYYVCNNFESKKHTIHMVGMGICLTKEGTQL